MENKMDNQENTHICSNCGHKVIITEDEQKKTGDDNFTAEKPHLIEKQPTTSQANNQISTYSSLSIAILTLVLVFITAYYAWQTNKLSNIANGQMQLSAEPNIDLISDDFNKIEAGKVKFDLLNQSPLKLINVKLFSKYYTHLIDSNLKEYTLYNGVKNHLPDKTIKEIEPESKVPIEFDYSRSGLTGDKKNVSFYLGYPPNVEEYTFNDIAKFYNRTYAEYKIDFQRGIDGKHYSIKYYYLILLHSDLNKAIFVRQTKDEILNSNRETASIISLMKSTKK